MKGYTKTIFSVCVGKKNGYDVYRVVWARGGHFYVKYKNEIFNVDADIENRNFTFTEYVKAF